LVATLHSEMFLCSIPSKRSTKNRSSHHWAPFYGFLQS
jgi:hypothetical protein